MLGDTLDRDFRITITDIHNNGAITTSATSYQTPALVRGKLSPRLKTTMQSWRPGNCRLSGERAGVSQCATIPV
jgi:hypothetical protein